MKRLLFLVPFALVGCEPSPTTPRKEPPPPLTSARSSTTDEPKDPPLVRTPEFEEPDRTPPEDAPPVPDSWKALNEAKSIYFEKKEDGSRRVHLMAHVCLREGLLEVLVCKKESKEHESILQVDADGRAIHTALMAAGAKPGAPVQFVPKYKVASGDKIKISLTYREKGKVKTVPAGEWVKDKKTGKDLAHDWVFAGSKLFHDPDEPNKAPYYMANNGEFISLSNFPDSMLDLPVKSPKDVADLIFEINTARIPPMRTPVIVTLEPVPEKK